jgi:hypothetical protein
MAGYTGRDRLVFWFEVSDGRFCDVYVSRASWGGRSVSVPNQDDPELEDRLKRAVEAHFRLADGIDVIRGWAS